MLCKHNIHINEINNQSFASDVMSKAPFCTPGRSLATHWPPSRHSAPTFGFIQYLPSTYPVLRGYLPSTWGVLRGYLGGT